VVSELKYADGQTDKFEFFIAYDVTKSFRTEPITKYTLTTINTH